MKRVILFFGQVLLASLIIFGVADAFCQVSIRPIRPQFHEYDPTGEYDFHAGIHSGTWTLRREQILEAESKKPQHACFDPYCQRCSKHLANYGHEYQYIHGANQAKFFYRNTWKSIAPAVKRGYDEHGYQNQKYGYPAGVMSWEYQQVLNHAIWEQLQYRNAKEIADAARFRFEALEKLCADSERRAAESKSVWDYQVERGGCVGMLGNAVEAVEVLPCEPQAPPCVKKLRTKKPTITTVLIPTQEELNLSCEYCKAQAKFIKDSAYLQDVKNVLKQAKAEAELTAKIAADWEKVAKLSKPDADRAAIFRKIWHKPPRYQEVFAAQGVTLDEVLQNAAQQEAQNAQNNENTPVELNIDQEENPPNTNEL
ncbi:MAG: hypothetical protein LBQ66_04630, partial [Planctomycetaceae bacterium]|nr:hypothetical protein [Planctomycetaceae bacterium]